MKFDRRYLPTTPRDSNNLKAKERNQVNCVAFKGQLLVDLMILYLGSRHLFVRTRFVRFLWLGLGSLLVPGRSSRWFFNFDNNAQFLVQKTWRTAEGKGYKGENKRTKYSHHEVKFYKKLPWRPFHREGGTFFLTGAMFYARSSVTMHMRQLGRQLRRT